MSAETIRYFDRASRTLKTEHIYGEKWLRLVYDNPAGRLAAWLLVRRAWFSRWYGWKMNKRVSALRILPFITKFNVDVDEFAKSAFDYKTFNEFFYRALKPDSRPIAAGDRLAVFPADGRHLVFPDVDTAAGFYVKGQKLSVADLLGQFADKVDAASRRVPLTKRGGNAASTFAGGSMIISRLCPSDYHRFHFPVGGIPSESKLINGSLYSVNPIALRRNIRYLVENKRMLTLIESPIFGTVATVEVGATNVGSIRQTFIPDQPVLKGAEKGFFAFGGSCMITLFAPDRITFDPDIVAQSAQCTETYAKMGERLGHAGIGD